MQRNTERMSKVVIKGAQLNIKISTLKLFFRRSFHKNAQSIHEFAE
jgi:hypothetical protein